jgi:para-nitrobenzyl esterase
MSVVDTKHGKVEGSNEDGLSVFRGIPYAKPPVGDLRFHPPEEPEPWTDTLQAYEFGPSAVQIPSKLAPEVSENMSEDCLSLNVWTTGCEDKKRPVMVWIHGGSFLVGSSKNAVSNGARIVQRGDVVMVSINYRVGCFGFLHLPEIAGSDYSTSGNIGLLDQIAALKWVRDNISAFGGNPENVTVFGCSAGGISISCLLTMPDAEGLFHRAITQSGNAVARSAASASTAAKIFMEKAGAATLDQLRQKSTDELLAAQVASLASSPKPDVFFGPVVDEVSLPEPPLHAIAEGRGMNVPILSGTTLDEMRFWLLSNPAVITVAPDKLAHVVNRLTDGRADSVMDFYKEKYPNANEADVSVSILSDINFTMPAVRMVESHSQHQPESWMYLFAWESPAQGGILGTPHAIEQPFVFGTLDSPFAKVWVGDGEGLREFSDSVQDAWLAFAKNGNPTHSGLPEWRPYEKTDRNVMRFDTESVLEKDPHGDIRNQWDNVPFDGIAPPVGVRPM